MPTVTLLSAALVARRIELAVLPLVIAVKMVAAAGMGAVPALGADPDTSTLIVAGACTATDADLGVGPDTASGAMTGPAPA